MTATAPDAAHRSQPIEIVRVSRAIAIRTIGVSIVAFFASAYCVGHLWAAIRGESFEPIIVPATAPPDAIGWLAATLGLVAFVVVPHELLHGVFMARYGGSRTYGIEFSHFLLPYAYAATDGARYTRNQLLVVLLAPLVGITAVGLLALTIVPSPLLVVALAVNVAGSIGDCWMAGVLARYPADVRVAAPPDPDVRGFAIYGPTDSIGDRNPRGDELSAFGSGTVGTLVLIAIAFLAIVFHALAVGTGDVVLAGDGWLLFRHELARDGTARIELGGRLLAGAAIGGGLAWTAINRVRRSFA